MLSMNLLCRIAALNRVTAEDRHVSVVTVAMLVIDSGREEGRVEGREEGRVEGKEEGAEDEKEERRGGSGGE
jgi:predicted transposase YdaD